MSRQSNKSFWNRILYMAAYFAAVFIGIALLLSWIADGNALSNALFTIANVMAYLIVCFLGFYFAVSRPRNRLVWIIIWAVAVTLIIVFYILRLV